LIHCRRSRNGTAAGEVTANVVPACDQADHEQDNEADDSDATASEAATTGAAPVLDIAT
jgi:hypothetical protein